MPFIQIHLAEGRSVEQKREIAAAVTADVSRIAEVSPDRVKIYFFDIKKLQTFYMQFYNHTP